LRLHLSAGSDRREFLFVVNRPATVSIFSISAHFVSYILRVAIEGGGLKAQLHVQVPVVCVHSASVRRTSMREKKAMSMKEAREEAQKLLESAAVPVSADDDDDDARSTAMNGSPSTSAVIVRARLCGFGLIHVNPSTPTVAIWVQL